MRWAIACAVGALGLGVMTTDADATLYDFNGLQVEVDYWADDGSTDPVNETLLVIDWNGTNGPYLTESHAWGYRWSGAGTVKEAIEAIDSAGALNVVLGSGGAFVSSASYFDAGIDADDHVTAQPNDWAWLASSGDNGLTWDSNGGGVDVEPLGDGLIEAINFNTQDWTGDNLNIPVPEPVSCVLLALGCAFGCRQRRKDRTAAERFPVGGVDSA